MMKNISEDIVVVDIFVDVEYQWRYHGGRYL